MLDIKNMKFELKKYYRNIFDADLIRDVKNVAKQMEKDTVSIAEYNQYGKYHSTTILNRFSSWFNVLEKAGLQESCTKANVPDEKLFDNLFNVWTKLERQPKSKEFKKPLSKYSIHPYLRKFGTWQNALEAFIEFINNAVSKELGSSEKNNTIKSFSEKTILKKRTERKISTRLRFSILLRDGFRCQSCGNSPIDSKGVKLHVDHITPWANGGETIPENLQTKCEKCNLGKGNAFNN